MRTTKSSLVMTDFNYTDDKEGKQNSTLEIYCQVFLSTGASSGLKLAIMDISVTSSSPIDFLALMAR